MLTADYTIRKYLINKLSALSHLQFPSKATVDHKATIYIGDSNVVRTQVSRANTILNGQLVPSSVRNLCEYRIEFVAVGQDFKGASDQIEKVIEALFTPGFFDDLDKLLTMPVFNIKIEESLMTTQAEATTPSYAHTQTISLSYGE